MRAAYDIPLLLFTMACTGLILAIHRRCVADECNVRRNDMARNEDSGSTGCALGVDAIIAATARYNPL